MVIVVGGMIGLGKTSVSEVIAEHLGSKVFYESVADNPFLEKFYTATEEEQKKYRYPFLLQLYFLGTRFKSIKQALTDKNNVLDRSIYEDLYFAKVNTDMGRISETEFALYKSLLDNMMEELKELPKKAPDLMVYLKGSFDTVIKRIGIRGRGFEDDAQRDYFYRLWKDYDEWVTKSYKASDILVIDMDKMDIVNNETDRKVLLDMLDKKLSEIHR